MGKVNIHTKLHLFSCFQDNLLLTKALTVFKKLLLSHLNLLSAAKVLLIGH